LANEKTIRVQLRDKTGAAVTTKDAAADTQRIETTAVGIAGAAAVPQFKAIQCALSFHEESADE